MARAHEVLLASCLSVLCVLFTLRCAASDRYTTTEHALAYVQRRGKSAYDKDLLDLAGIPSISALPEHVPDVERAATWLSTRLSAAGLQKVELLQTEGPHPVVYAEWLHAGAHKPTVLVYGHYDVQPVDPLELWDAPPFEPAIKDGHFIGRGVDDDKAGVLQAVHAIEAYLQGGSGSLPVNVKLLLEGQEEIGSPNLPHFLTNHKDLLAADLALSADGGQISATQPGIATSFRGAAALEVELSSASSDMHSGIKGGSVLNPIHALSELLAGLHAPNGSVAVQGFYDDVAAITDEDRADIAAYPFDVEQERNTLGVLGFTGEQGFHILEQRWHRPTLEVVGVHGGFTGAGMKTIVPSKASAKISCRLVPNQQPADIAAKVKAHLEAHAHPLANATVTVLGFKAYPWTSPRNSTGNQLAARVLLRVMHKAALYYKDGGTIPALAYFDQLLSLPTTVFAFGLGDHIHAPNERYRVNMWGLGRRAWVELLGELGASWPSVDKATKPRKQKDTTRDEL